MCILLTKILTLCSFINHNRKSITNVMKNITAKNTMEKNINKRNQLTCITPKKISSMINHTIICMINNTMKNNNAITMTKLMQPIMVTIEIPLAMLPNQLPNWISLHIVYVLLMSFKDITPLFPSCGLFDGGSTSTWIKASSLPCGVNGHIANTVTSNTITGNVKSNLVVDLNRIVLPKFQRSCTYRHIEGHILHIDCHYDVIFGRDALSLFGYKPDFETHLMKIGDDIVPMHPLPSPPPSPEPTIAKALLLDSINYELFDNDQSYPNFDTKPPDPNDDVETNARDKNFAALIHANSYDAMDMTRIINDCDYLDSPKKNDLICCLSNYPTLFDGVLCSYPGVKVHLDVDPNVTPHATRAYSVPQTQLELFKKELG